MGSLICYTAELMEPQTLVITGVRDQARATRSFDLRAGGAVYFTPGQVAVLRVEGEEPAYFAFAGAPEDRDLEVLVKQKAGASAVIYNKCVGDQIELVGIAGGDDIFPERAASSLAKDRILADPREVIARRPDIIIGSWCGKKFRPEKVAARPGYDAIPAVRDGELHEVKSPIILQPGPAALTDGLDALHAVIMKWAAR